MSVEITNGGWTKILGFRVSSLGLGSARLGSARLENFVDSYSKNQIKSLWIYWYCCLLDHCSTIFTCGLFQTPTILTKYCWNGKAECYWTRNLQPSYARMSACWKRNTNLSQVKKHLHIVWNSRGGIKKRVREMYTPSSLVCGGERAMTNRKRCCERRFVKDFCFAAKVSMTVWHISWHERYALTLLSNESQKTFFQVLNFKFG